MARNWGTVKIKECVDCHELFETRNAGKIRCDKCQRRHKSAEGLKRYHARRAMEKKAMEKARLEGRPYGRLERKRSDVKFLSLPDAWAEGRLPESVTKNQVFGW